MAYRFVEHTGEIEVELAAASETDIFEAALAAFVDLVDPGPGGAPVAHEVELTSADHALLLVDWLSELVFLAETAGFVPGTSPRSSSATALSRQPSKVVATTRATWSRRSRSTASSSSRREVGGMAVSFSTSELVRVDETCWEIPAEARPDMRVPARVFADRELLDAILGDQSLEQLQNVATLPGIVGAALAMPDIHQGYGFPVGGVAAMELPDGVVSPGGVGYATAACRLARRVARLAPIGVVKG